MVEGDGRFDRQRNVDEFIAEYARRPSDVERRIARSVLGHDVGNDYTTLDEARALAGLLELTTGDRLLDLGCGRGWPGMYLRETIGCSLISADIPLNAVLEARSRFREGGLAERVGVIAADGRALPLPSSHLDGISHADVFC